MMFLLVLYHSLNNCMTVNMFLSTKSGDKYEGAIIKLTTWQLRKMRIVIPLLVGLVVQTALDVHVQLAQLAQLSLAARWPR